MVNGMPKVLPIEDTEGINTDNTSAVTIESKIVKFGGNGVTPINNILIGGTTIPPKMTFLFYYSHDNHNTTSSHKTPRKYAIVNEKLEHEDLIQKFNFSDLEESCRLYREFTNGQYWAYHNEIMGLATNLLCIKGGRDKFIKSLEYFDYDIMKWEYYCNYFVKMDYSPMRCDSFCPYSSECEHTKNMIEQARLPKGQIRILNTTDAKTLEQAEKELKEHMEKALSAKDNKIYVIKAPTGIGKTELYLDLQNVTIALPTHKLKEEIEKRMRVKFASTPKLPEDDKIKFLYSVGCYMFANQYIRKMAKEGNEEYQQYLTESKLSERYIGTLLTTHDKLLSLKNTNSTIIIDEDIINTLLPVNTTTLDDLETMAKQCFSFDTMNILESIKDFAKNAGDGLVYQMPSFGGVKTSKLEQLITDNKINTNVLGFLNCEHFVKYTINDKSFFYYINKRELPEKKKIIMLSATANEYICKLMFGDRLEFIDIGNVRTQGEIQQYPQRSFSRYQMDDNLKKIAKALVKDKPVITYKEHKEDFNTVATFGATEGLDTFKGKDIAVIGTPHVNPTVYLLFANALGKKPRLNDCRTNMQYVKVKRNGFEFYFNTFSNDDILQEMQLYLIESELVQAIGRARILRNNCIVTVLSNLPIQGAKFKYLTKEELQEILAS